MGPGGVREALDRVYSINGYFRIVAGSIDSDEAREFLLAQEPEQRVTVASILDGALEEARSLSSSLVPPMKNHDLVNRLVLKHAQKAFGLGRDGHAE